eukprot:scaffold11428_cov105-Isochrysis_galbana.AAC.8
MHALQLGIELRIVAILRDNLVVSHRLVREEETDGIEAVPCEKIHVKVDRMLAQSLHYSTRVLAAEPIDSFENERLAVRVEHTAITHEFDETGLRVVAIA